MATISVVTPHTRIDNEIIDNDIPRMGPFGFTIYVVLKRFLNQKTGQCNPSYKTIARKTGIDRSTIIRYVKKLKALNLISPDLRFKEDGSRASNQYHFEGTGNSVPSKKIEKIIQREQDSRTQPPPLVTEDDHLGGTAPPKQVSLQNKKQRSIAEVDLMPTVKQKTCPHPPSEIVVLPDQITICNHCYGLLDENHRLVEEDTHPAEGVSAA